MTPVTTRTNIESPKISSAGVELGANMLVEEELGAAKQWAVSRPAPASLRRPKFKVERAAILIKLRCSQHRTTIRDDFHATGEQTSLTFQLSISQEGHAATACQVEHFIAQRPCLPDHTG